MTKAYDWSPMPHEVAVVCPECVGQAVFEFAESVKIGRKSEVEAFKAHPHLEYRLLTSYSGQRWHAATFYAGLHLQNASSLRELPDGYEASQWEHPKYFARSEPCDGAIRCVSCGIRRRHVLRWPADAYFKISHRGEVLWAFNRESAVALRDFIASNERDRSKHGWRSLLLHVPAHFLGHKDRDHVVKQLERLLGVG